MNNQKIGELICQLRKEQGLTQKQLAERMHLSDRTISKWERGLGCPDIALLYTLSDIFGVHMEKMLKGDLSPNNQDGGNMKRIAFYICPTCGNILTATTKTDISCCGRKLMALDPKPVDEAHRPIVEMVENDYYITFAHEMRKDHYIQFAACVGYDRYTLLRLYPEQGAEVRLPYLPGGTLYFGCSCHGLWNYSLIK